MPDVSYRSCAFRGLDQAAVLRAVRERGWAPATFTDPPGAIYPPHRHATAILLVFLAGDMTVTIAGRTYHCVAEDELVIAGEVEHAAVVGADGCTCGWSEQMREPG